MAVTLKFLSRAMCKTAEQVIATSPRRFGGEATSPLSMGPCTPKTPLTSPSRFSKKSGEDGARVAPFFEDFETKRAGGAKTEDSLPLLSVPHLPQLGLQKDSPGTPAGSSVAAAVAMQRAAAAAAAQQELAASALPAAELARQSFLAKMGRGSANGMAGAGGSGSSGLPRSSAGATTAEGPGAAPRVGAPALAALLGRGEDAANAASSAAPGQLPVLLGHAADRGTRTQSADPQSEKEIAELVREAFLARQERILGRGAARKVP